MAQTEVVLHKPFLRRKWKARPPSLMRLNNLSPSIGLLELSNALDFAANVWNAIPPPPVALVFMALGATGALALLAWATFDFPRAWRNYVLLRNERQQLRSLSDSAEKDVEAPHHLSDRDIQIHADMNTRELGNETIDRLAMYVLLGFGAFTVGLGTYMAMGGVDQLVFLASNIITGYVGNVPAALYGLLNAAWCVYGFMRARRHEAGVKMHLKSASSNSRAQDMGREVKSYTAHVRLHAWMNGITGICGGAGSLMTATAYIKPIGVWGYVILLPCAISSFLTNIFWRRLVYYDRDVVEPCPVNPDQVLDDAVYALEVRDTLSTYRRNVYGRKPLLHLQRNKYDETSLRSLLTALQSLAMQHAAQALHRLTTTTIVAEEEKSEDQSQTVTNPYHAEETRKHQTRHDLLTESLEKLRVPSSQSEKRIDLDDLIREACSVLVSLGLFHATCQRMANSKELKPLFFSACSESSPKGPTVLQIDESQLLEALLAETVSEANKTAFLKLASAVLASEGTTRARSQVRYYCEYSGCVFGRALA